MDELALQVIKLHWQRERWKELEEHKIMEKCLDEFYELGELTLATSAELAEYRQLLELSHPELMSGEQAWIGFGIAFAHVFFTQFGLNTKVPLSEDEIKSVQAGLGVEPTGRWGLVTVRAAKELQKQLQDKGLYTGPVDGLWGSKLAAAWRNDRRQQGLGDATTEKLAGKRAEDVEQSRAVERLRKLGIPEFPFDSTSEQQKGWAQTAQTALQNRLKELTETFRKLHGRYPLQGEETPLACEIRALNKLDTLIRIGLRNREAQRQRQAKQQLEDFWKDFFAKGGQWSKMRDKFQLECIELWVAAACFAYDAAAVASWVKKKVIKSATQRALEKSIARQAAKKTLKREAWRSVRASRSLRAIKHGRKHLNDFLKIDPDMTSDDVAKILEYVRKTGVKSLTHHGRKAFEAQVNIGGKKVMVRVVESSAGNIVTGYPKGIR